MAYISVRCALPLYYVLCKLVMIECNTYKSRPLFMSFSKLSAIEANSVDQTSKLDNDPPNIPSSLFEDPVGGPVVKTVAVKCHKGSIEVVIKADLFGHGLPVKPTDLSLGPAISVDPCKAVVSGREEYTIRAPLNECGTVQTLTDRAVVYDNLLLYMPSPRLPGDVTYTLGIAIPVQCVYGRWSMVSSGALRPTWSPLVTTHSSHHSLDFRLRLMTDDWSDERESSVYLLGDMVNIEASVAAASHLPMSLYVDTCVASLSPDVNSEPTYAFIAHQGCFTDSRLTGSRSRLLPRVQDEVLRIQLEPFLFYREDRRTIYITCFLEAVPISKVDPVKKACYFTDRRWRSVDGDNHLCESCERDGQTDPSNKPAVHHSSQKRVVRSKTKDTRNELHKTTLGPFVFLPWNLKIA